MIVQFVPIFCGLLCEKCTTKQPRLVNLSAVHFVHLLIGEIRLKVYHNAKVSQNRYLDPTKAYDSQNQGQPK